MANRFWVGGTGTWDGVDTTHWSGTSGGAGGQSAPGSSDAVTFDGSSGGGTVTVNTTVTIQSLTCGAHTGTLEFSANNNNVNLSAAGGLNASGSGTRTLNLGNGTWSLTGTQAVGGNSNVWNIGTTTGLTFNANSSTIVLSGSSAGSRTFAGGGLSYNTVTFDANAGGGSLIISGTNTFATLNINGPNNVVFPSGATTTITNAINWAGTSSAPIGVSSSTETTRATISTASGSPTMAWAGLHLMTGAGGATFTATNSLDLGANTGITITPPNAPVGRGLILQRGTPF